MILSLAGLPSLVVALMSMQEVNTMNDDLFSEQDANDDYLYGKDFQDTYCDPDILDWTCKGW